MKKYSKENFKRDILEFAENADKLSELEAKYITIDVINDPLCYNLCTGGNQKVIYTEEARKNMSEAHKGKKLSEEHKRKIILANTGKKRSLEARKNISEGAKTVHNRQDVRDKHRAAALNMTAETRSKISSALKGKQLSETTRKKISECQKGKKLSEEHKAKLSLKQKNAMNCIENRAKISAALKGRIFVNNGEINLRCLPTEIPDGFVRGLLKKKILEVSENK